MNVYDFLKFSDKYGLLAKLLINQLQEGRVCSSINSCKPAGARKMRTSDVPLHLSMLLIEP